MALELVLWCFVLVLCWCFLLCWSVLVLCAGVVGALCFAELQLADVTTDTRCKLVMQLVLAGFAPGFACVTPNQPDCAAFVRWA